MYAVYIVIIIMMIIIIIIIIIVIIISSSSSSSMFMTNSYENSNIAINNNNKRVWWEPLERWTELCSRRRRSPLCEVSSNGSFAFEREVPAPTGRRWRAERGRSAGGSSLEKRSSQKPGFALEALLPSYACTERSLGLVVRLRPEARRASRRRGWGVARAPTVFGTSAVGAGASLGLCGPPDAGTHHEMRLTYGSSRFRKGVDATVVRSGRF